MATVIESPTTQEIIKVLRLVMEIPDNCIEVEIKLSIDNAPIIKTTMFAEKPKGR